MRKLDFGSFTYEISESKKKLTYEVIFEENYVEHMLERGAQLKEIMNTIFYTYEGLLFRRKIALDPQVVKRFNSLLTNLDTFELGYELLFKIICDKYPEYLIASSGSN